MKIGDNGLREHGTYQMETMHTMDNGSGARTQVKRVTIKNGKGRVTMEFLNPAGKVLAKHSHELSADVVKKILDKQFVPTLFEKCLLRCGTEAQNHTPRNAEALALRQAGGRRNNKTRRSKRD
jgi:hypothetical protein